MLLPKLAEAGHRPRQAERAFRPRRSPELDARFHNEVFPILTPIAIDPGHPFPQLRNKSLNLGVMFQRDGAAEAGVRRRAGAVDAPAPAARSRA